ncbi:MAG: DUF1905 domain-containing protein [Actinobacteria bacterium]|nr:DUF1905 domain-containing protein [Actinomycetota bacterium]
MPSHGFTAELWVWDARQEQGWTFVTLPEELSSVIRAASEIRGPRRGFGAVRVGVRLGSSRWQTSVFPDTTSGCYVLPIKKAVRRAEQLTAGDEATIELEVR